MENSSHYSEIRLLGETITVRSDSDPEVIDEAIHIASTQIRDAEVKAKGGAAHKVALLALLNLAEEYVQAKHRVVDYRKKLSDKTNELIEKLEMEK